MYKLKVRKILFCLILIVAICYSSLFYDFVYASTDSEIQELIDFLDEYEENLGDLNEFQEVFDQFYNDLDSAINVTDSLKEKLREDIDLLDNVTGMNSAILSLLKTQFNDQVDNLTNDNLTDMRKEIKAIKEWVDGKIGAAEEEDIETEDDTNEVVETDEDENIETSGTNETINADSSSRSESSSNSSRNSSLETNENTSQNETSSDEDMPYTGKSENLIIMIVLSSIVSIILIIKYKQIEDE